jgi:uncharacterized protein YndB with AHSA1/START domain
MATVDCVIDVPPGEVFAVLSNGWYYSNWVVGTSHMRAVEAAWPAAGSKLFHASGAWPLVVRDESVVEHVEPDHRLVLTVRGWPLGEARVVLLLEPEGSATRITMSEEPIAGPGRLARNRLGEALLLRRNTESLARLTALTERRTTPIATGV